MTKLKIGQSVSRAVPSKVHDCRKNATMVVTLDLTLPVARVIMRPMGKKSRSEVSITIDGLYEWLVKQAFINRME